MQPISDELNAKLCKQLEYYFSDYNLHTNAFIKDLITKDNGWIRFETLNTFNRLKQLADNNSQQLHEWFKNLTFNSDLIEVNVSEEKVRRRPDRPLPPIDEALKEYNERTVHLDGFPEGSAYEDLMQWLQTYGSVEYMEMRYKKTKTGQAFKGCLFCTYTYKSMADSVLNESETKFGDKEVLKENKSRYFERKHEFVAKCRAIRAEKKAERKASGEVMDTQLPEVVIPIRSTILKIKDYPKEMTFQEISEHFKPMATVKYVLKVEAMNSCFVRIHGKPDAEAVLTRMKVAGDDEDRDGFHRVSVNDKQCMAKVLTGDEEKSFWRKNTKRMASFKKRNEKREKHKKEFQEMLKARGMTDLSPEIVKRVDRRVALLKKGRKGSDSGPVREPKAVLVISDYQQRGARTRGQNKRVEQFRKFLDKKASVVSVDQKANGYYYVRFRSRNMAKNVLTLLRSGWADSDHVSVDKEGPVCHKVEIDGVSAIARVLSGKAETDFWLESIDSVERKRIIKEEVRKENQMLRRNARRLGMRGKDVPKVKMSAPAGNTGYYNDGYAMSDDEYYSDDY